MRRLTDQISVDELRSMREAGMTNQDIANSLGVSVITVRRYIGSQPARRGGKTDIPMKPARAAVKPPAAALAVTNHQVSLTGEAAEYSLDTGSRLLVIQARGTSDCMAVSLDSLDAFCLELQAVQRCLEKLEAW